MGLPVIRPTELESYAGMRVRCDVAEPRDEEELAELFAHCRAVGRKATLRGQGFSLDEQALNRDLVISMTGLAGLAIDAGARRAHAGGGVSWGRVVAESLAHGCMPPVVVTCSAVTVGGTLASNSYSRFTPVRGKEIEHVSAVWLVTPGGERLRCSRESNADVFAGVVGGFGYLGAVTRVELALDPAPAAVSTQILALLPIGELMAGLAEPPAGASRYAVILPRLDRGLLFECRNLAEPTPLRRYRPVHQPRSLLHLLGQVLLRSPLLARGVWWLGAHTWSKRPYVDPVFEYTFFMDGNARLIRLGRRLGLAMRAMQQTFLVPPAAATGFIAAAQGIFAGRGMATTLADVVRIPGDAAVLSSSRGMDGMAVSFSFEVSSQARLARVREAFAEIAGVCGGIGGRVHLTKNVVAAPEELARMYGGAIEEFAALKRRLDPDRILENDFLRRNFPALGGP